MFKDLPEGTTQYNQLAELKGQADKEFEKIRFIERENGLTIINNESIRQIKKLIYSQISIAYKAGKKDTPATTK